jgi:hypothetical protein
MHFVLVNFIEGKMLKKIVLGLCVVSFIAGPIEAFASAKHAIEPTGAERQRQYALALKGCQKQFGGSTSRLYATWESYYGRTGWWCIRR